MASRVLPSIFPTFLLPSFPFRRRTGSQDSTVSTDSNVSTDSASSSSAQPGGYLSGTTSHLCCSRCSTDLCLTTQIISKGFTGRYGRAYLVSPTVPYSYCHNSTLPPYSSSLDVKASGSLPNIHTHKPVPRQLVTGAHVVSDISCAFCGTVLGWKYVGAEEESQRYKVGKFILETKRVRSSVCWDNEVDDSNITDLHGFDSNEQRRQQFMSADVPLGDLNAKDFLSMPPDRLDAPAEEDIEFDSQDEDECDDLFAGVWSPALAAKRRKGKVFRPT